MGQCEKAYRVCRSNRKIASIDIAPDFDRGAAHVELYRVRFWDMGNQTDYEFQKIADVYPDSIYQLEDVVHCFGVSWECMKSFEDAIDVLTSDYYERMKAGIGVYARMPIAY